MAGDNLEVCLKEVHSRLSPAPVLPGVWWLVALSLMGQRTLEDLCEPRRDTAARLMLMLLLSFLWPLSWMLVWNKSGVRACVLHLSTYIASCTVTMPSVLWAWYIWTSQWMYRGFLFGVTSVAVGGASVCFHTACRGIWHKFGADLMLALAEHIWGSQGKRSWGQIEFCFAFK